MLMSRHSRNDSRIDAGRAPFDYLDLLVERIAALLKSRGSDDVGKWRWGGISRRLNGQRPVSNDR